MIMGIEVITFCLAGYSVRSWSRPPRVTETIILEERRPALMSRLCGHSEYSDPLDWSLEYPVSTESCVRKAKTEEERKNK